MKPVPADVVSIGMRGAPTLGRCRAGVPQAVCVGHCLGAIEVRCEEAFDQRAAPLR